MNEFGFNGEINEKIDFIKKLTMIVFVFIIVFLIVRGCNNYLTNKIREDINKDKVVNTDIEKKEEIDLNKPFSYYKITNDNELRNIIYILKQNIKPYQLQKYIDLSEFSITHNWSKYKTIYEYLNVLLDISYRSFLKDILDNKVNYDEVPLTDSLKKKLKDGFLNDYIRFDWTKYDFEKRYFVISDHNGEAQDDYYFNFILDEEGYLDDIVLEKIVPMYDEEGIYIPKKDSKLMNNEEDIKLMISQILLSEDQYVFDGDEGYYYMKDPQSRYNRFEEFGFTDKFREYYKELNGRGLVDDKLSEYDNIYVENIDIGKRKAVVKLEIKELNIIKYYDISWTTDENYRMDTIEAKFNKEELK